MAENCTLVGWIEGRRWCHLTSQPDQPVTNCTQAEVGEAKCKGFKVTSPLGRGPIQFKADLGRGLAIVQIFDDQRVINASSSIFPSVVFFFFFF